VALDPEMIKEVLDVMIRLARAASHAVRDARVGFAKAVADRVIFMDPGPDRRETARTSLQQPEERPD